MATDSFKLDRSYFSVGKLSDPSDEVQYWRSRPPEERMAALEFLRQQAHGYDPATARVQRVFEIVKRSWR